MFKKESYLVTISLMFFLSPIPVTAAERTPTGMGSRAILQRVQNAKKIINNARTIDMLNTVDDIIKQFSPRDRYAEDLKLLKCEKMNQLLAKQVIQQQQIIHTHIVTIEQQKKRIQEASSVHKKLNMQQQNFVTQQKQQLIQQQQIIDAQIKQIIENETALTEKDKTIANLQRQNKKLQTSITTLQKSKQKESSAVLRAENKQVQEMHTQELQALQQQLQAQQEDAQKYIKALEDKNKKLEEEIEVITQEQEAAHRQEMTLQPGDLPDQGGEKIIEREAEREQELKELRNKYEQLEKNCSLQLKKSQESSTIINYVSSTFLQMKSEIILLHQALKSLHDQVLSVAGQDKEKAQTLKVRFDDHGSNIMRYYEMINNIQSTFNTILSQLEKLIQSLTISS